MAKRRQYDDKFRASVVVMLQSQGYPAIKGALTHVANHVGVPAMTISRWFHATSNPPPNELVNEKRGDLVELLRDLVYKLVGAMPDKIEEAALQQQGTVLGIVIDKLQLLEGKATERVEVNELSDTDRAARIATLLNRAGARRDGRADSETIH